MENEENVMETSEAGNEVQDSEDTQEDIEVSEASLEETATVSGGDNIDLSELILLTEENNLLLQELVASEAEANTLLQESVELAQTENMTIWEKPLNQWNAGEGCLLILLFVVLLVVVCKIVEGIIKW